MSIIGENIRKYRKAKGLTQAQLADLIGVHVYAIKSWEGGRYEPNVKNTRALVEALGVSANTICGLEPSPEMDYILEHPTGRSAFIDEVMTMPEERFKKILRYSEFLKREASAEGTTDASGK